jgi:hypothetical protein
MKRFEALLEQDEDLSAEWEELRGTRRFIGVAGFMEDEADFSFTLPVELPQDDERRTDRRTVVRGPWRRWLPAAVGFSLAAAVFAVLLFSGLRVDRTPDGWLVGFSGAPEIQAGLGSDGAGADAALTREDFAAFARELVQATDQRLTMIEERRSGEQAVLVRGFLEALDLQQQELSLHQQRNYEDLRARVDVVAYGLAASQRSRQVLNPVEDNQWTGE